MTRFVVYDPVEDTYVKFSAGGWVSGFLAHEVNSYHSLEDARNKVRLFHSLRHCVITEISKTVDIVQNWELV